MTIPSFNKRTLIYILIAVVVLLGIYYLHDSWNNQKK